MAVLTYNAIVFATTYNAIDEHVTFSSHPRASKRPTYPGVDGEDYLSMGRRARTVEYKASLHAGGAEAMKAFVDAIEALDDGNVHDISIDGRITDEGAVISDSGIQWGRYFTAGNDVVQEVSITFMVVEVL